MSATYDSRFKRLAGDPRFVLINNYKCGFSSSNLLAPYYSVERVDHFVELEHSERFFDITNIRFPYDHTNESSSKIKHALIQHLVDDESQQGQLRRIYEADLDFQSRHDLECVRLQPLGSGLGE